MLSMLETSSLGKAVKAKQWLCRTFGPSDLQGRGNEAGLESRSLRQAWAAQQDTISLKRQ